MTQLLDQINSPLDLRHLDRQQLSQLAQEIRERIIEVVSQIGGHFGGNLGIVELTLALHYVFDTPQRSLAGGFGAAVMERVQQLGIENVRFHGIGIPDEYVHHGTQDVLRARYDLHAEGIARRVREFLRERVERPRLASIR